LKRSPPVKEFVTKDGRWCVLRPPTARDLDGLTRFANAFVREKRNNPDLGLVSFDRRLTRRQEGRWLGEVVKGVARKEVVSIAAFVGGRVVGHCAINRRKFRDDRHAGVFGIAILDGFRGVGIGEKMMDAALEEARRIGIQLVELDVFSTNAAAIRLYEKMGFEKAGTIPDKIFRRGRYYDEDVMFLDLRKR
jgi:ribosomal protein S18 acetylase RimI-like enzyme